MSKPLRIASSIVVANSKFEILFVKRAASLQWANAFVFPGGVREDAADGGDDRLCAVRELFEETGLIFDARGFPLSMPATTRDEWRAKVHGDATHFANLLRELQLSAASFDAVKPFTRWTTPREEAAKKRFDTRFFFVQLHGPDQTAGLTADRSESTHLQWLTARNALDLFDQRRVVLAPPTWFILRQLSQFQTVAEALRAIHGITRIEHMAPSIAINDESLPFVALPGDEANLEHENADAVLPARPHQRRRIVMHAVPDNMASRDYRFECNIPELKHFQIDSFGALASTATTNGGTDNKNATRHPQPKL
jgi:8-oxo-dGTP pyrophosphatase MutT (NUDIX family)